MNAIARDPLPANIEAEQGLLGGILMNNDAIDRIPSGFSPEHFFEKIHRQIFEAILAGRQAKKGMNPVTVRSFMPPEAATSKVGDITVAQYLTRLMMEAVNVINVPDFADAITGYYNRREAMAIANDAYVAGIGAQDELEFVDRITECRERLTAIVSSIQERNAPSESFLDAIDKTLDSTADAMSGRNLTGIDPGIDELTSLTGLWQPGNLIIIGGDVKQGKSALAWQSFFNIAENHPIAGNSGEMPRAQIILREKARRTGISAKRQKAGQISDREMQDLVKAGADMKRLKFIDIDCQRRTLDQLDKRIERLVGEEGIEAYVVDHILKLLWTGKMEDADDFKKANRATSTLKDIAMKHGIPIIALTHVNKTTGYQENFGRMSYRERLHSAMRRRPTYKSLLGNIDKDADHAVIVFQARPIVAAMEPEQGTDDYAIWEAAMNDVTGKAELILALSRENEFPRRRDIPWTGATTSFGPAFKQTQNERGFWG